MQPYVSLTLTALVLMGSPGPATIGVTACATAFGLRRCLPYLVGSVVGTAAVLMAVAAGLASFLLAAPHIAPVLLVLSACYLGYLAFRIATAPPLAVRDTGGRPPTGISGFVLAVANPKAYAAIGTVLAGSTLGAPVKIPILTMVIVLVHLAWALAGASFTAALRRPRTSRIVNIALAAALVASATPVLLTNWG